MMDESLVKLNKLSSDFEILSKNMDTIAINNRTHSNLINNLRSENKHLRNTLRKVEMDLIEINQYSRRQNIEISNIPESIPQHKLENHVIKVLGEIGIYVKSYDLVGVHRLGKYHRNSERNVIVRFINRKDAYEAMEYRRDLRNTNYKYYIHENMCPTNRKIYNKCYKYKKNGDICDVWFSQGVVCIQIGEDDTPVRIFHVSDIKYFLYEEQNIEDVPAILYNE